MPRLLDISFPMRAAQLGGQAFNERMVENPILECGPFLIKFNLVHQADLTAAVSIRFRLMSSLPSHFRENVILHTGPSESTLPRRLAHNTILSAFVANGSAGTLPVERWGASQTSNQTVSVSGDALRFSWPTRHCSGPRAARLRHANFGRAAPGLGYRRPNLVGSSWPMFTSA